MLLLKLNLFLQLKMRYLEMACVILFSHQSFVGGCIETCKSNFIRLKLRQVQLKLLQRQFAL